MGALAPQMDSSDDAARALQVSKAAGASPSLVATDPEGFEDRQKAALTDALLKGNNHLVDYANSHPLATSVSQDDWGQMDAASQAMTRLRGSRLGQILNAPTSTLEAAARGFKEGFGSAQPGQWLPTDDNTNRLAWSVLTAAGAPIELASKVFSGGIEALRQGSEQASRLPLARTPLTQQPNAVRSSPRWLRPS